MILGHGRGQREARGTTYFVAKTGSTSLQNNLFEHNSKSRSVSKGGKTVQLRSKTVSLSTTPKVEVFQKAEKKAQLRSKTASSSTTLKVEVFQKAEKRLNFAPKQLLRAPLSCGHYAVTTVTTRSLRSLRGHYGHYAVTTRSLRGHYAVTTRSLRSLRGHYGHYAVRKSTYSRQRKRLTSLQNGQFDQDVVAIGL